MGMFDKEVIKFVEVPQPLPLGALTNEAKDSLVSLQAHPGFQYLLAKLKLEKAVLETKLKRARHKDMRDVEFIQSGIFWAEWLEMQVAKLVTKSNPTMLSKPTLSEEALIREMQAAVETVGE